MIRALFVPVLFCLLLGALNLAHAEIDRTTAAPSPEASPSPSPEISSDLKFATEEFLTYISSPRFSPVNCAPFLNRIYGELMSLPTSYFDESIIEDHAQEIIDNSWRSRLELRHAMGRFYAQGAASEDCADAMRGVIRAARFIEDYVSEKLMHPAPYDGHPSQMVLRGTAPELLVNPQISDFRSIKDLRSGDVLMVRDPMWTSSTIARIADVPSQFSHNAIVRIDPVTQQRDIVQAEGNTGLEIVPLDQFLEHSPMRIVVMRHPDPSIGARAADKIYDLAVTTAKSGRQIKYDFKIDDVDHKELYCSEVIQVAFEMATQGQLHLPLFRSRMLKLRSSFLKSISIESKAAFLPGDLEVDPRLEMVAEWRDVRQTYDVRMNDLVLTQILNWMGTLHYELIDTFYAWLGEYVAVPLRHVPLLGGWLVHPIGSNMPQSYVAQSLALRGIVKDISHWIETVDTESVRVSGYALSPAQVYEGLESLREQDLQKYLEYKACVAGDPTAPSGTHHLHPHCVKPLFHMHLRPIDLD